MRLDWDAFFNHPLFSDEVAVPKTNNNELFAKIVGDFIVKSKKVNDEFENYQKAGNAGDKQIIVDPLQLNIEKNPEIVSETSETNNFSITTADSSQKYGSDSYGSLEPIFKENSFRYYHEKNKILLIFLTVKKLRQVMKMSQFAHHSRPLYLLMLILAKKGAMLSELTLYSLNLKNNIFKLQEFDAYCEKSEECQEAIRLLKEDQPCIFSYHRYLLDRKSEAGLKPDDEQLLTWLNTDYIDLKKLDIKAKEMYQEVRSLGIPPEINSSEEMKHIYYLAMIFTLYSIKSEIYMPYILDNSGQKKFQWENFRNKHENLDGDHLAAILNNLNC